MKMREGRIWSGVFVAAMLTAVLIGTLFFGWRVAGLPFVPFDMFDWLTRVLPGRLIAFGIDTMVNLIRLLRLTSSTAKMAEQTMAIAGLFIAGTVSGVIVRLILPARIAGLRRSDSVNQRMFALSLTATALVTLLPGCAGSGVLVRNSDLSGIWHGTLGQCRADQYEDEALITLQIKDDGTFTANVIPNRGANNLAKPSKLAGTVVTKGNRVTLRNEEGPWTWLTLVRTRDGNVLYGVAHDPAPETNVMLKFERDGSQQSR
jgi:hypothetical protein